MFETCIKLYSEFYFDIPLLIAPVEHASTTISILNSNTMLTAVESATGDMQTVASVCPTIELNGNVADPRTINTETFASEECPLKSCADIDVPVAVTLLSTSTDTLEREEVVGVTALTGLSANNMPVADGSICDSVFGMDQPPLLSQVRHNRSCMRVYNICVLLFGKLLIICRLRDSDYRPRFRLSSLGVTLR